MQHIWTFWYSRSFQWTWTQYLSSVERLEQQIAVRSTIRNLTKPLFQDYTWQGRVIGILFRVIRVVLGSLLYLGLMSIYLIGYAVWLAWPLICLWAFLGYFLGLNPQDLASTNSTPTQEVISDF